MTTIFGIRHHGAGSARSLKNALATLQPDCVLIEGPPDADAIIDYVANKELIPPIALLVYNPSNLKQAAYYPFAHFSPEWQAMTYAVAHQIPVSFMDLPRSLAFSIDQQNAKNQQKVIQFDEFNKSETQELDKKIAKDPLGYVAKLAGYEDSERWWDITFERSENPIEIFQSILNLMSELRQAVKETPYRELQREAFMRHTIRETKKKGYQNIAVICGAWHAPVLEKWETYKASSDKKFLKGIKKIKTKATWVPWTYQRISRKSGYGAGIISPAWYELLFDKPESVTEYWMSNAAQLLRQEDLEASSANVIEAVRLAKSLATIRNLSVAGIQELREAAVSILCGGDDTPFQLIENQLIIGNKMGEVPEEIPVIPLQQDLNQCIKKALLTKEKNAFGKVEKKLDLRKPKNLLASHLLHRLQILDIHWGVLLENSQHTQGSFKEVWNLEWDPDFAIRIIEAGMWGNTVYEAASSFVLGNIHNQTRLSDLTQLIETALKADLKEIIFALTDELSNKSALTKDIFKLMQALPSLVNILRYGSSRNMDVLAVNEVVSRLIPRICIGLPNACVNIDEDLAATAFQNIQIANRAIHTLSEQNFIQQWYQTLEKIRDRADNGTLVGLCVRILFDKNQVDASLTGKYMSTALSQGHKALFSAQWIEGFLQGSGLLLIYNDQLWQIVDDWIDGLQEERFMEILPVLRRTFSKFTHPERQKMLDLVKRGKMVNSTTAKQDLATLNQERIEKVLPTLKLLLDL